MAFNQNYRKMNIKNAFKFIVLACCVSCANTADEKLPTVFLDRYKERNVSEVFAEINMIPLKEDSVPFFKDIDNLEANEKFFIAKDKANDIYLFDKKGLLVSSSRGKRGKGAGEYTVMTGYSYNPYSDKIEVLTPTSMIIYSTDFSVEKIVPLPTTNFSENTAGRFFSRIFDLSEDRHILIPTSTSEHANRMYIFNSSRANIESEIDYSDEVWADITMQHTCFFKCDENGTLFCPPAISNYIYKLRGDLTDIERAACVDFGENGLNADMLATHSRENEKSEFLLQCKNDVPVRFLKAERSYCITVKRGSKITDWYTQFYIGNDSIGQRVYWYDGKSHVFPLVSCVYNNSYYAIARSEDVYQYASSMGVDMDEGSLGEDLAYILEYKL